MKVVVVGGGVVGLCCARELALGGAEVTVVERDRCGGRLAAQRRADSALFVHPSRRPRLYEAGAGIYA